MQERDWDRAQAVAQIGNWRINIRSNEVVCSAETYRIFGLSPDIPVTYDVFLDAVHPGDREGVDRDWTAGLAGVPSDIEFRVVAGGQTKWVRTRTEQEYDAGGALVSCFGTTQDITDKKRAEEALRESEERFRAIFENAAVGVAQVAPNGAWLRVNKRLCEITGYPAEELLTKTFQDISHDEDLEADLAQVRRMLRGEIDSYGIDKRYLRKNGSLVWVKLTVGCARNPDNTVAYFVTVIEDISERKLAVERLRRSEEKFRGIYQHAATAIAILDLEGRFQSCNPAYSTAMGYTEDELRQLNFRDLIHPDDRKFNLDQNRRLLEQEIPSFEIVNRFLAKDGRSIWVHKHVSLLRDAAGIPTSLVALVTDITERKRAEEQVRLLMHEVNHRSKNMLALVQAVARQTLASSPGDFITRFGERIQALARAQDLLVKSEWQGVDLAELIWSQLAHFEDLIGTRIELKGPPLLISAAAAQTIGMALHELATNAGKYGALTSPRGRVQVKWSLKHGKAGGRTFTMSWRELGGPPVTAPGQFGFGSTVIRSLAESSLDAKVYLDFAITGLNWRIQCGAGEVLQGNRPATAAETAKPAGTPAQRGTRSRVLVVEDEPLVAVEIAHFLNEAGFAVIGPVRAVAPALSLIEESGCDIAVLDINLGGETSESIAWRLLAGGTPFITLSGYSQAQHPAVFNGAPALAKPLRPELLVAELRRILAREGGIHDCGVRPFSSAIEH